jgi:hypothetical protein
MPSRVKSHKASEVPEVVHGADHYAFFPASGRDKSFTSRAFRFMVKRETAPWPGGNMRIRVFCAVAMIAVLAGPGYAQNAVQRYGEKDKDKTWGQMEQEKEAQRAYKRSLDNVPEKGPVDPWGNARNVGEPKGDAKAAAKAAAKSDEKAVPAKPKTKTGSGSSPQQ